MHLPDSWVENLKVRFWLAYHADLQVIGFATISRCVRVHLAREERRRGQPSNQIEKYNSRSRVISNQITTQLAKSNHFDHLLIKKTSIEPT